MQRLLANALLAISLLASAGPVAGQSIALVSDLNGRYGSVEYDRRVSSAADAIVERGADFVLSAGDMVAGQKRSLDDDHFERMWAAFDLAFADALLEADIPILVTPGNHDGSAYPGFERERAAYRTHWAARTEGFELLPGSDWPEQYAARIGDVLAISFNGTRPGRLDSESRAFLASMLEQHAADAIATLVFSHLPMWPLAERRDTHILDDPDLLDLMHRHGVDAYISGHHHVFYAGVDSAGMLHVSVSPGSGNTRPFVGRDGRQPLGLSWLDIGDGAIAVRTLVAPGFDRPMPLDAMPDMLRGPLGVLRRVERAVPLRTGSDDRR